MYRKVTTVCDLGLYELKNSTMSTSLLCALRMFFHYVMQLYLFVKLYTACVNFILERDMKMYILCTLSFACQQFFYRNELKHLAQQFS